MKKEINKNVKKETSNEMLARLVVNGFERIEKAMATMATKKELTSVKQEIDSRFDEMNSRLINLALEQSETNRRLTSIEKKQMGTILSLDETVHRNEFNKVVQRVEVLEKR